MRCVEYRFDAVLQKELTLRGNKVKKVLMVVLAAVLVVCFSACSSETFMSNGKVNRLVKEYGETIQAEMTIEYNNGVNDVKVVIKYDLQLAKAPITVANFVALATDDFYDGTLLSTRYTTANALRAGLYKVAVVEDDPDTDEDESDDLVYQEMSVDYTIKGEFIGNLWETNDLEHGLGNLVMYHASSSATTDFDGAGAEFYICMSSTNHTHDGNFAVFATIAENGISYYLDNVAVVTNSNEFPSVVLDELYLRYTTTDSVDVIAADGTETTASVLDRQIVITSLNILGDADFANLIKAAEQHRIEK